MRAVMRRNQTCLAHKDESRLQRSNKDILLRRPWVSRLSKLVFFLALICSGCFSYLGSTRVLRAFPDQDEELSVSDRTLPSNLRSDIAKELSSKILEAKIAWNDSITSQSYNNTIPSRTFIPWKTQWPNPRAQQSLLQ